MWHKAVCTICYLTVSFWTTQHYQLVGTLHHYMFTHTNNGLADGDSHYQDSSNLGLLLSGLLSEHYPVYHHHKPSTDPNPCVSRAHRAAPLTGDHTNTLTHPLHTLLCSCTIIHSPSYKQDQKCCYRLLVATHLKPNHVLS